MSAINLTECQYICICLNMRRKLLWLYNHDKINLCTFAMVSMAILTFLMIFFRHFPVKYKWFHTGHEVFRSHERYIHFKLSFHKRTWILWCCFIIKFNNNFPSQLWHSCVVIFTKHCCLLFELIAVILCLDELWQFSLKPKKPFINNIYTQAAFITDNMFHSMG